ncbi:formylglycine-generating enzyme family protein [Elongatibacter sediminis]|uniref:SUMF1/EgtB/PvdO family nonheme iron enzyme n=1 Tax=Elongatibacter sediminis TaxID=3119006 RepID=A0AAW9R6N9_9GAMM
MQESGSFSEIAGDLRARLLEGMSDNRLTPRQRQQMGNALAMIGDPRFREDRWFLPDEPDLGFVHIPEGPCALGENADEVFLPGFYIARFQTTVAQFRAFVTDAEFSPGNPECLRGVDNHPVPWVNWFEALAYTKWLGNRLQELAKEHPGGDSAESRALWAGLADGSLQCSLPSEAEWQKAAVGDSGWAYPWGDDIDTTRCNYKESELDSTVAVGTFPEGASPYGVLDMSGNAWDWQRTVWGPSLEEPLYDWPYKAEDGRENIDAPSDLLRCMRGGGFPVEAARASSRYRDAVKPEDRDDADSFRVVLTPRR